MTKHTFDGTKHIKLVGGSVNTANHDKERIRAAKEYVASENKAREARIMASRGNVFEFPGEDRE